MRNYLHHIAAAGAALLVIVVFLLFRITPPPVSAPSSLLVSDVYPLYTGLSWKAAEATSTDIGSTMLSGIEVESQPVADVTDLSSISTPFENYYAQKLFASGWSEDQMLAADGAGSSVRVFRKADSYIVLGYMSVFKGGASGEPAECPCDMTFSVFTGTVGR